MNVNLNKTVLENNKSSIIYYLPSILFKRRKPLKIVFSLPIIIALIIFSYGYYKPNFSFVLFVVFFISVLILSILSAPRKLVFNQEGMQYHIFWKMKWSNFIGFSYNDRELTIKTKNNKNKIIKITEKKDFDAITNYLSKKKEAYNE